MVFPPRACKLRSAAHVLYVHCAAVPENDSFLTQPSEAEDTLLVSQLFAVEQLIQRGVAVNTKNQVNYSPLCLAAYYQYMAMI